MSFEHISAGKKWTDKVELRLNQIEAASEKLIIKLEQCNADIVELMTERDQFRAELSDLK